MTFRENRANRIFQQAASGSARSSAALQPNRWTHVAGVKSGTDLRVYIDGANAGEGRISQPVDFSRGFQPKIGGNAGINSPDNYRGLIDDLKFFSRALTQSEVQGLYSAESQNSTHRRAIAVPDIVNGFLVGATLLEKGSGYTQAPDVHLSDGTGSGAVLTAEVVNGSVQRIIVINAGSGYTHNAKLSIAPPPGMPSLTISVSRVLVRLNVTGGKRYRLDGSNDLKNWAQVGPDFIADNDTVSRELSVTEYGAFYKLTELP